MKYKVSVVIPVYGVERYIERCARTLFEQTLDNIEYIFIDDCSPDKSMDILLSLLDEYPQRVKDVVIHHMSVNSGQAKVREWGMKNARGEFVIHCDTDDWLDKSAYEKLYNRACSSNADVVICDYIVTSSTSNNLVRPTDFNTRESYVKGMLLTKVSGALWNKLVRRNFYEQFLLYPEGNMGEDMAICIQFLLNANHIEFICEPLYWYFNNSNSITKAVDCQSILNRYLQSASNADVVLKVLKEKELDKYYAREIDVFLFNKKQLIVPLIKDKQYYDLWVNAFREINWRILINNNIGVGQKLKHILRLLRLYK